METHNITTTWKGNMQFESTNPSGDIISIDAGPENGGEGKGLRPKALMLSALAGCTGLDVASLIEKMKLEVTDFKIETSHRKSRLPFLWQQFRRKKARKSREFIGRKILWCDGNVPSICKS